MYESPIDIIYSEMQTKLEGEVFKAVQNVGINVNKDELIKALSYDRHQYEKGYADAKAEQQWIPVTKRLPGYGEDVLVSIGGYCNVGHIVPTNDEKQYNWYYSGWYHDPYDVDAWMPLPMPWEGGAEECH